MAFIFGSAGLITGCGGKDKDKAAKSTDGIKKQPAPQNKDTAPKKKKPGQPEQSDIVTTAIGAGSFKTLVAAVQAAGLVETLKGDGPFTVFAPTDEAFAKLPKETLAELLKPENKAKLAAILPYHVVPGKVMAAEVVKLTEAKTVQGSSAKVTVDQGTVKVDAATVTKTDIACKNGVIHIIDSVILPKQ